MANVEIKKAIKEKGIFLWQVADMLGISESTFYRWLRKEFSEDKKQEILTAIGKVK